MLRSLVLKPDRQNWLVSFRVQVLKALVHPDLQLRKASIPEPPICFLGALCSVQSAAWQEMRSRPASAASESGGHSKLQALNPVLQAPLALENVIGEGLNLITPSGGLGQETRLAVSANTPELPMCFLSARDGGTWVTSRGARRNKTSSGLSTFGRKRRLHSQIQGQRTQKSEEPSTEASGVGETEDGQTQAIFRKKWKMCKVRLAGSSICLKTHEASTALIADTYPPRKPSPEGFEVGRVLQPAGLSSCASWLSGPGIIKRLKCHSPGDLRASSPCWARSGRRRPPGSSSSTVVVAH